MLAEVAVSFAEVRKPAPKPASSTPAGETDEYEYDFDEPEAVAAAAPTYASFTSLTTADFEQMDLNDLSDELQACIDVILHVSVSILGC